MSETGSTLAAFQLPRVNSYTNIEMQRAYERYLAGDSQRKILSVFKIAPRTLARRCKADGWEAERRSLNAVQALMNAGATPDLPTAQAALAALLPRGAEVELRSVGMERMLREWQALVAKLRGWVAVEMEAAFADGKRPPLQKIMQLGNLVSAFALLDKKVWCVPDKIEMEDRTPTAADGVRSLTDEQLSTRIEGARVAAVEAERRERAAPAGGETPEEGVN